MNSKLLTGFILFSFLTCIETNAQSATTVNISGTSSIRTIANNVASIVDSNIVVTANGSINSFTISITGSYTTGDVLGYTGSLPSGITAAAFNTATRSLAFSGTTTPANWHILLRTVTLTTTSAVCNPENRLVSFVVGNKYYNILNGHFYEYYSTTLSWTSARAYAANYSYYGRQGYLATPTSQSENSFSNVLVGQNSWIGCSDNYLEINAAFGYTLYASQALSDGNFYWVTGPERGMKISSQNSWGSGGVLPVAGVFNSWASGEPNDWPGQNSSSPGEEDYGHMYTGSGLWNDYSNSQSIGSIIEFGNMPGDNTSSKVVITRSLNINGAPSGTVTGGNVTVCTGSNSTTLTLTGLTGTVVRWESSLDNFLTSTITISNTTTSYTSTNITVTTYFRAVVNTLSGCSSLATSSTAIIVNTPIAGNIIAANNTICTGSSASFTLFGNIGNVVKWQVSTSSTFASSVTDISNTTTSMSYALGSNGTYYFRAVVQISGCGSAIYTPGYTITVITGTSPVGGSVNTGQHCTATNSGTLTLSGYTGTIQKWQYSVDGGIIWIDIVNTVATQGYTNIAINQLYRAVITNGSCGTTYSSPGSITIFGTTVSRWDGGTSNAWQTASNWCGGIADNGIDVVLNSSASNHLVLDQNRIIGNLNFNGSNKIITIGNYLLNVASFTGANASNYIKTTGTGMVKSSIANGGSTTFPIGKTTYNPLTITNNTGNTDVLCARVYDLVYYTGYSGDTTKDGHVRHTWDISKTNANSGSGLNFVFNWNAGEAYNISTATLYHYDGSNWIKQVGSTSSTATSLTYTGYTGTFSPFAIGNPATPLPVTLLSFDAITDIATHSTLLKWSTATETESRHFDIQRSDYGSNWQSIGTVNSTGSPDHLSNYEFRDLNPNTTNLYRLNQVDMDGKSTFSNIVKADFNQALGDNIQVYPNPTTGIVNIITTEPATFSIIDINGRILNNGNIDGELQLQGLAPGLYLVQITIGIESKNIKLMVN